ncbi:MAG: UDP-N-acetylmuramoyl-L-alanyl-D-glutamate-2,6-diaminopimelate ligase [Candidatus Nomurabacteria bacterium GW2011_GWF2_35_66]|uniref:UDP-N-acetylmuramoyl-L-alanyl-D-glutamate--2,6-diaminopimelate ligase n=1 Tax=Candidatus Nomurabacteria bacterium GW2011_GWE1_35_16 TaxID=1618761 RepID=A0A0G0BRJ5_9BACT|nr:MAG: UDP-N-acetylmuramoyl-L-alanyl-D-glutamate-2,6-diaminopimelate ligase [Candidatus Nomurabacteria bacterium GW2011_GWF1_34_20]KKP62867.1 MAG: UDP-N-acetylmuramoyl-L-alanyl-D-glutamate-2,6-diaminopimelate ligase [Candidatus Nomurabacteria bacterium GW2011_GWE2_34_25]KKP66266.1 MAG: UDP-N-acetylmuramoyl-L-alanyl-D-glutamate-2,6-diaminopimelate ligase [Candidatus Nomurabacteria bacterium GW2011_GWE1_35_16]KKP83099.1 MAG: UDP-N-acetylmuramoyl-L-alanyl-D-glutamate-2,6-diaminopimelate ligase [Ca
MKILNELLNDIAILETHGNIDAGVSSISLDSRAILPHSLFVALVGNVTDGHNFIDEVIEKGAKTIVYEKDIGEFRGGITYIKVADSHEAVGLLASNFYGNPSQKMKLVGITGTSGKTTTATLLHQLFRDLGYKAGLIGTVVNKINDFSEEAHRTTPDAVTLNELLARMVDEGCEYCFMEVSSHSVSEKRISGLHFVGGIFTNLSLDHLDYHKTLDSYADAKKEFFDMIPMAGFAIANIDDERGEYMLSTTKAHTYTLSLKKKANFNERFESRLIGEFNAYNLLGIYAVAVLLGQEKAKVIEIIKNLEAVPGRFQYYKSDNGVIGIVDYAHKPDALENVLKTANDMKGNGKLIVVVGCGGDRDKSKRPIMAKIGYDMSDILVLTSDNPRTEKPADILEDMRKGIDGLPTDSKVYIIPDRREAIAKACLSAVQGDIILIAGKGHETYQEVNGVQTHFDDLEELHKYLK